MSGSAPGAAPAASWASRLGLLGGPLAPAWAWIALGVPLAVYATAFVVFYPQTVLGTDEAAYLRQAVLYLEGRTFLHVIDPLSGDARQLQVSGYPVGTAVLLMPFVVAGGRAAVFWLPFLCVVAGVLLTAAWIREERGSPLFALLVLGFPSTLGLGRVAMSDAPSLFVVALGLWLFWRGRSRGPAWSLAAGFVAGVSILVRESNALPFVPFFAGAVLRRDRHVLWLAMGGLAGVALRALSMWIAYDDPLYYRVSLVLFGQDSWWEVLALHALGLLVLVPGGLVWVLLYRGPRAPELVASVLLFAGFYLAARYAAQELSPTMRVVMGLRFFLPLLPLLAFAAAEVVPRLLCRARDSLRPGLRRALEGAAAALALLGVAGVAAAGAAVHAMGHRVGGPQAELRETLTEHVDTSAPLVTNLTATGRYLRVIGVTYEPVERRKVSPEAARDLLARYGRFFVAFLDREDSPWFRRETRANERFLRSLPAPARRLHAQEVPGLGRLRIFEVGREERPGA